MSLLMDALRKAEEAKKQAEQERTSKDSSLDPTVTAAADNSAPELPEIKAEKPTSPDLSVMLEFEDDVAPAAGTRAAPPMTEDLDRAIETVSLTLDASAPKRPSLDQKVDSSGSNDSGDIESFFSAQDIASTTSTPSETAEIELSIEPERPKGESLANKDSELKSERSIDYSVEPTKTIPAVAPREEARPNQGKAHGGQQESPATSISQRTAKSRQSAKSVFAAKNSNSRNQKTYLYLGAGIAAALVLSSGYFLLSSGSSNTGFTIPEGDYISANETEYSDGNSGNIERGNTDFSEAQINQDASLVSTAPETDLTASGTASAQMGIANAASEQIAQNNQSAATGLDVTSNLATSSALVAAQPTTAPIDRAEDIQPPATAPAADVPVSSDSASNTAASEPVAALAVTEPTSQPDVAAPVESEIDLITFRRKETSNQVSPQLTSAYSAYQAGNLDSALALYNQVLSNEPQNIDALLGKAAISSAQGDVAQAMALYSTVLALNPSQAIARSGLLSLLPTVSPADQERQLRRLVTQYPSVAPLAFALGNFYASQSRWVDAQKNYFNALGIAKLDSTQGTQVSPDYAFNLAISLDRLNQPGPATMYYQEALSLASQFPANFDAEIARARINRLSGPSTP